MLLLWEYGPCGVKTLIDHMPDPKPHFNTVATFIHIPELTYATVMKTICKMQSTQINKTPIYN